MDTTLQKFWTSLDRNIVINKRELFLGIMTCTLAGILTGILFSPKKVLTIGSNNGSNNVGKSASAEASSQEPRPEDSPSDEQEA